jgi:D-arabinose 1-dehydrogenase-like Zn-dependent alcohol dehydrogenase
MKPKNPKARHRNAFRSNEIQTYVDFTKSKDLVADVKAATPDGLGAHAVILLAVSEKPFQQATEYVRSRGTIIAIGLPPDAFLKAPVLNTVVRMISIKGSYVGNRQDGVEALDFFARGLIKAPFKLAPLEDLPKIFDLMGSSVSVLTSGLGTDFKQNKAKLPAAMCLRCPSNMFVFTMLKISYG